MTLSILARHHLRYVLFRLKSEALGGTRLTQFGFHDLTMGWGLGLSKSNSRQLLIEIKNHFSDQLYFTGWENFAEEKPKKGVLIGTSKSWDVGMIDGDGSEGSKNRNRARMINRPNKWFLFEKSYLDVVPTRDLSASVTQGLDYFERRGLASSGRSVLRERRIYPDRSGRDREFDYDGILLRSTSSSRSIEVGDTFGWGETHLTSIL